MAIFYTKFTLLKYRELRNPQERNLKERFICITKLTFYTPIYPYLPARRINKFSGFFLSIYKVFGKIAKFSKIVTFLHKIA